MPLYDFNDCPNLLLDKPVDPDLGIIVCIPSYNEPYIEGALLALISCEQPICSVEIIVLINESDEDKPDTIKQNELSYQQTLQLKSPDWISILPVYLKNIPKKSAGVGIARKKALDEAAIRLSNSVNATRILACFDADSTCSINYLKGLEQHFIISKNEAVSIHYEHEAAALMGTTEQRAIYLYELHLRYFVQMQAFSNLPFAYHTVGSSMACTVEGYQRIGGMNKRKAGEDFYFLQKFIKNNSCDRLHTITVFPSSRSSDRVPFGTGRAILKMSEEGVALSSYNIQSFLDLKEMVDDLDTWYENQDIRSKISSLPSSIEQFLIKNKFDDKIKKLKQNTSSHQTFRKAFFQLFDAFQLMKYLHFARDKFYPDKTVIALASEALALFGEPPAVDKEILSVYRKLNLSLSI